MQFKEGMGWKACYDEERSLYTAQYGGMGSYHLYEIDEKQYHRLKNEMTESDACDIISEGRHLYMDINDRCGPPYTVVFDDDYQTLCPWASVISSGKRWSDELTDAAVELFASGENNREQRRKKREARNAQRKEQ